MAAGALSLYLLAAAAAAQQQEQAPPPLDSTYDTDAFFVPPSRWVELGALLTQHKVIRLAAADYTGGPRGGAPNITISSGMKVYGLPGTRVPTIVISPVGSHTIRPLLVIYGYIV